MILRTEISADKQGYPQSLKETRPYKIHIRMHFFVALRRIALNRNRELAKKAADRCRIRKAHGAYTGHLADTLLQLLVELGPSLSLVTYFGRIDAK